jgi:hypothetical protein
MAEKPEPPTNWAQARAQIARGATCDKIAVEDPAAAPLGTDAEAAGTPMPAADIARSVQLQRDAHATAPTARSADRRLVPWLVVILALVVAVILALVVAG